MTAVKQLEHLNAIDEGEFEHISRIVFDTLRIKRNAISHAQVEKKGLLITIYSSFLEKYLELQLTNSRQDRLEMINFIDKLNMQKELLELKKGETKIADIRVAAQRLGKKAQSAFSTKLK